MKNQNEFISKDKVNILISVIVILSTVVLMLSSYICYDKILNNKKNQIENNTEGEKNVSDNKGIDNDTNLDFDFNTLSVVLHSSTEKKGITTFISNCQSKTKDEAELTKTEQKNIEVSNETIDIIIKKLKTAKSIEKNITYSWLGCPPKSITYFIGINDNDLDIVNKNKVFSLNYADGDDILLVGYNNAGYAFHFNSSKEINNFIESLK